MDGPGTGGLDGPEALASWYDAHARPLHHYLARRAGTQVADDLVADVFLVAWERRASFDPGRAGPRAWLYGIATNLLLRHRRTEETRLRAWARDGARRSTQDEVAHRATESVDADVRVRRMAEAISGLRAEERDVLLLVAWAGLTTAEISEALGVREQTVRTRLHRARTKLRTKEALDG
ncbi:MULTISPECIES: RNA polymerase sigma factor [Saccharothrix]|uniref:RNA polymerase sigma-70 factor (ECF subfamily) n=1 Tax=Saccharothrix longispora TaxID=33920 RepID=A0ABU1PQ29_9PSEU|nr:MULTISPECIES: sigma-70 family RNA polymerase sigma factor [Saccharothrix]MBY8848033.1 sigma-70 family RNA polymerase sigma factor [Saccharothrix sp. MB29]MDR6592767.1 RNA polymerase sigma-70 factor (ECF subfamily) [Saccharothrix longispora]MDU0291719.1 sigma-70 family RNA polymerase sigma factor [Saccharothrix longispora]